MIISESEQVIYESFLKQGGVFDRFVKIVHESDRCIILYDGNFLYPLGDCKNIDNLPQINHGGILGRESNVQSVMEYFGNIPYIIMKKYYAKLEKLPKHDDYQIPEEIQINNVIALDELKEFCQLKSDFLKEESGVKISPAKIFASLKENFSKIHPVIAKHKNRAIGMISSNFHSTNYAMINMLYIKMDYRRKGYGKILLRWYISELKKQSKNIYLFFSPDNKVQMIYQQIGFKTIDKWIMATNNS